MAGTTIGQVECQACGEKANVQEAKTGSLVIWCNGANGCKSQTFVKTPRAVQALRSRLSGNPNDPTPAKKTGLLDAFK